MKPMSGIRKGEWFETAAGHTIALPERLLRKLRHNGGIQTAGTRTRYKLFPAESDGIPPFWHELDVLYEDDFCLVVNKPANMLVHPTVPEQRRTLANAIASYYECTGQQVKVRHIHRLDENTTGPVLYAKNEFAQLRLDEAMRIKAVERIYIAFVQGKVAGHVRTIDAPIGKDRHRRNRRRVSPTGANAVTHLEVLETYRTASLVRLRLETGRTHQIRVHASYIGHPVIGDELYGGSAELYPAQALHGEALRFPHPLSGERVHVDAPWPDSLRKLQSRLKD